MEVVAPTEFVVGLTRELNRQRQNGDLLSVEQVGAAVAGVVVTDGTYARLDELAKAVADLLVSEPGWAVAALCLRDEWDALLDSSLAVAAQRER